MAHHKKSSLPKRTLNRSGKRQDRRSPVTEESTGTGRAVASGSSGVAGQPQSQGGGTFNESFDPRSDEDHETYITSFITGGLTLQRELMFHHEAVSQAESEYLSEFHRRRQSPEK